MEENKTLIKTLKEKEVEEVFVNFSDTINLHIHACDMMVPLETRLNCLATYVASFPDETQSVINRLLGMYAHSGSKLIEEYLEQIIRKTNINFYLKCEIARTIYDEWEEEDSRKLIGYELILFMCQSDWKGIDLNYLSNIIIILMNSQRENYRESGLESFKNLINDTQIDDYFRYRLLIDLEKKIINEKLRNSYLLILLEIFLKNEKNFNKTRLLACQYLLAKNENVPHDLLTFCREFALNVSLNRDLDVNVRAEAVDIILNYGTLEEQRLGGLVLIELGMNERKVSETVYNNQQNVHNKNISDSAVKGMEKLFEMELPYVSFETFIEDVNKLTENKEKNELLTSSLNRLYIDRATYSKYNVSLSGLMCKVWSFIKRQDEEIRKELIDRTFEELIDSSAWCSTGFAHRLVNILSGYLDFGIQISFEDQIVANLSGRLNAKIKGISDENLRVLILEEMTVSSSENMKRQNFLAFFRKNISGIREEMYNEFKEYVSDDSFDLYFRKGILNYIRE